MLVNLHMKKNLKFLVFPKPELKWHVVEAQKKISWDSIMIT